MVWQDDFDRALTAATEPWGLKIGPEASRKLGDHFAAVVEANRVTNLTRITEPAEAAVKHYADSLALLPFVRDRDIEVRTVLDIGTGAGFPAIPLAIMRPDWRVTGIDATRKKVDFVRQVVTKLGLANVDVVHARGTDWHPPARFDMVVVRAIAKLADCLRQSIRSVSEHGLIVVYKTANLEPGEVADGAKLAAQLGLTQDPDYAYELPGTPGPMRRVLKVYKRKLNCIL